MASVQLNDQTAQCLIARARAEGISVDELVERLLRQEQDAVEVPPRMSVEEFDKFLDEEATDTPGLPADFSRADIYFDHD